MKKSLEEWKKDYQDFTEKASEINRSLALGGIGVIWIFKNTSEDLHLIPSEFVKPLLFLVLSLGLDLGQYIIGGLIWLAFFKYHEHWTGKKDDIRANQWLPIPIHIIYLSKLSCTVSAYVLLIDFFIGKV